MDVASLMEFLFIPPCTDLSGVCIVEFSDATHAGKAMDPAVVQSFAVSAKNPLVLHVTNEEWNSRCRMGELR